MPRRLPGPLYALTRVIREQRSEDQAADRLRGADFSRRALDLAGDDPTVLVNAAYAMTYFGGDIRATMALIDRALTLNPNFARGWHVSGVIRIWAGEPDVAIEHAKIALRLSPRASLGATRSVIAAGLFYSRRFEEAVGAHLLMI